MADKIHTGVVGLPIRLTLLTDGAVHDPSSATTREITIVKPSGDELVRNQASAPNAVTVGTDSDGRACLQYVTAAGELDLRGTYTVMGRLVDAAGTWPAEPVTFRVYDRETGR